MPRTSYVGIGTCLVRHGTLPPNRRSRGMFYSRQGRQGNDERHDDGDLIGHPRLRKGRPSRRLANQIGPIKGDQSPPITSPRVSVAAATQPTRAASSHRPRRVASGRSCYGVTPSLTGSLDSVGMPSACFPNRACRLCVPRLVRPLIWRPSIRDLGKQAAMPLHRSLALRYPFQEDTTQSRRSSSTVPRSLRTPSQRRTRRIYEPDQLAVRPDRPDH
jgi:hypothetical protein